MTLFRSLVTATGYDPVREPGSSYLDADAQASAHASSSFPGTADQFYSPSRWGLAVGLDMVGFISYGATLVLYATISHVWARNTQHSYGLRDNISTNSAHARNPRTNECWVLTGTTVWWFIYQQHASARTRATEGRELSGYRLTAGPELSNELGCPEQLHYTSIYLFASFKFLLADSDTVGRLCLYAGPGHKGHRHLSRPCAGNHVYCKYARFLYIQRYWKISTKVVTASLLVFRSLVHGYGCIRFVVTILVTLWGMIGICLGKCLDDDLAMMTEFSSLGLTFHPNPSPDPDLSCHLTPSPSLSFQTKTTQFFGLFGLSNRASSMIDLDVIQAASINDSGNNQDDFSSCSLNAPQVTWFAMDVQNVVKVGR
ncbi:hypothetical protein EDB84DRAFT_1438488 [Lactarius hengduanensis]|nr:hypothetical protein EDB84DRAFT_1438488 [Lactarius hengduanensis]